MPDNLSKAGLQRIYGPKFHKSNLHHLIPKTRNGQGTEYNLFPYSIRSHGAYHDVFLNLRINEVWEMFNRIHSSIFEPEEDYIVPWWIEKCKREIGTADEIASFNRNKKNRMAKTLSVTGLQDRWVRALGSEDRKTSRDFIRLMMLFMVFGKELLNKDTIFDNSNIIDFLEKTPCMKNRFWAFEKCFGQCGTAQSLKSRIVTIVDRFDYYADVIL